ncbi:CsbD family protein [Methylobacterium sp. P1-11]|uniref:CsbD family protein n=1 Tax=Methylobacterium sp. P1-11 TaxID=2024616 RepID=UPI0011EE6645|nr:CsbD family protein [Methylobacterium sp. P1-11]KAA0108049.1 CsbD family protein [Methylobacterium sp. P1-11]
MVDTDRITGAAKELGGKVQGAVGDLTGSQRDSVEGRARQAAGQAENLYGQAKDTVRDIGGKIRDTVGGLVGSDDVEHRARRAQGAAEEHFDRAQRSVYRAADEAADYAEDAYERGGHVLRRGTREVSHQVAEYPLASLLIAGAVGFGLGLLVSATRD